MHVHPNKIVLAIVFAAVCLISCRGRRVRTDGRSPEDDAHALASTLLASSEGRAWKPAPLNAAMARPRVRSNSVRAAAPPRLMADPLEVQKGSIVPGQLSKGTAPRNQELSMAAETFVEETVGDLKAETEVLVNAAEADSKQGAEEEGEEDVNKADRQVLEEMYSKKSPIVMNQLKSQVSQDFVADVLKSIDRKLLRLWTKADFLHAHAVSGVAFLGVGVVWQVARVIDMFAGGSADGVLAANGFVSAVLILSGLVNALTAIPMSQFNSNKLFDITDLKGNGFALGGTGLTAMCCWLAWWFSGAYPAALHPLDAAFVGFWSFICIATTVNWEVMLKKNFGSGDAEHASGGGKVKKSRQDKKFAQAAGAQDEQTVFMKKLLYRLASWPNLTQILFMSSIALGGTAWLEAVLEKYPLEMRTLFDYSFASAIGYALSMFGETLRDRKLITLETDFGLLLAGTFGPMLVVLADVIASGGDAEINVTKYWYIFAGLLQGN